MRIIAGKHRGRVLAEFRGKEVRPTSDRVKESLFQILTPRLFGAHVLDLFTGSGALGIEALSRGAASVHFNDSSRESLALCKKNLASLGETGEFSCLDFRLCLKSVVGPFDLIFADPPYKEDYLGEILTLTGERGLLKDGGLVIYEGEREGVPLPDSRGYGRTKFTFLGRSDL